MRSDLLQVCKWSLSGGYNKETMRKNQGITTKQGATA